MKNLIKVTLLLTSAIGYTEVAELTDHILKNKPTMKKSNAEFLAMNIVKVANAYNINPKLYSAILMRESSYNLTAKNCRGETCFDFGIAQININTINAYDLDLEKIQTDLEYSLEAGAKVLSWFKKTYKGKEPTEWWVRYNVGTRDKESVKTAWDEYYEGVSQYL